MRHILTDSDHVDEVDTEMGALMAHLNAHMADNGECFACRAPLLIKHMLSAIMFENDMYDEDGKADIDALRPLVRVLLNDAAAQATKIQELYIEHTAEVAKNETSH